MSRDCAFIENGWGRCGEPRDSLVHRSHPYLSPEKEESVSRTMVRVMEVTTDIYSGEPATDVKVAWPEGVPVPQVGAIVGNHPVVGIVEPRQQPR